MRSDAGTVVTPGKIAFIRDGDRLFFFRPKQSLSSDSCSQPGFILFGPVPVFSARWPASSRAE